MTPPYFCIFVIISPLKRTWTLICTILHFLYLRIICIKFNWNLPGGSGEEYYLKFSVNFYSFALISPWGRGLSFICTILNALCLRMMCQVWLKLAKRFWRRSWKCKSLTDRHQTDGQTARRTTEKRRSEKLTWAFSSGELKTLKQVLIGPS
jgi:hypothetical protein